MSVPRGQLSFDFLVGVSLFLITVGFVFNFAPVLFDPFTTGAGGDMITGDRSAVKLSGDLLVDNGTKPNVLNTTCTEEFFDADGDPPACGGSDDAQDLNSALGVNGNTKVNVTIEDNGTIVNTGTQLSAGPSPTSTASVTVSQRIVLLDGEEETLFVRVW